MGLRHIQDQIDPSRRQHWESSEEDHEVNYQLVRASEERSRELAVSKLKVPSGSLWFEAWLPHHQHAFRVLLKNPEFREEYASIVRDCEAGTMLYKENWLPTSI